MEDKLISEGRCLYCSEMVSQRSIVTHLKKHLQKIEKENPSTKQTAFLISIKDAEMFLQVLIKGDATFEVLDNFLRDIWMECCGHLSSFYTQNGEISFTKKMKDVLEPKLKLNYDYDFGSTTTVMLQVADSFKINMKEKILLLSRNEPLKIMCRQCHQQPASSICMVHVYDEGEGFYCGQCAEKHAEECEDFADYAEMPVVNSPRMGVCGYEGGQIDTERDGVYKEMQR
jgi:hypothetical protein